MTCECLTTDANCFSEYRLAKKNVNSSCPKNYAVLFISPFPNFLRNVVFEEIIFS